MIAAGKGKIDALYEGCGRNVQCLKAVRDFEKKAKAECKAAVDPKACADDYVDKNKTPELKMVEEGKASEAFPKNGAAKPAKAAGAPKVEPAKAEEASAAKAEGAPKVEVKKSTVVVGGDPTGGGSSGVAATVEKPAEKAKDSSGRTPIRWYQGIIAKGNLAIGDDISAETHEFPAGLGQYFQEPVTSGGGFGGGYELAITPYIDLGDGIAFFIGPYFAHQIASLDAAKVAETVEGAPAPSSLNQYNLGLELGVLKRFENDIEIWLSAGGGWTRISASDVDLGAKGPQQSISTDTGHIKVAAGVGYGGVGIEYSVLPVFNTMDEVPGMTTADNKMYAYGRGSPGSGVGVTHLLSLRVSLGTLWDKITK